MRGFLPVIRRDLPRNPLRDSRLAISKHMFYDKPHRFWKVGLICWLARRASYWESTRAWPTRAGA